MFVSHPLIPPIYFMVTDCDTVLLISNTIRYEVTSLWNNLICSFLAIEAMRKQGQVETVGHMIIVPDPVYSDMRKFNLALDIIFIHYPKLSLISTSASKKMGYIPVIVQTNIGIEVLSLKSLH